MSAAPLTCQEVVELVTDDLEDRLAPGERARFERHLDGCEGCRAYLEQMRAMLAALGRLEEPSLPAPMRDELLQAFRDLRSGARP